MRYAALRRLSYSSLLSLHKCPKLFQLSRLKSEKEESIHFAYGHAVGSGIQAILSTGSLEKGIWAAFLSWSPGMDLLEEKELDRKSFWYAVAMLEKFYHLKDQMFTAAGWEVAQFLGEPAIELGARIDFPDDFHYLLFIDVVLVNKRTGELKVLELKTTKNANPDEALYANSWQAILYSIFLDAIAKDYGLDSYSSYEVLYLVVSSKAMEISMLPFKKSKLQKARAIQNIFLDIERIQKYEEIDSFPLYGESCYNYAAYKPCVYFGMCQMRLSSLLLKTDEELEVYEPERKENKIHFSLPVSALIEEQLKS